MRISDLTPLPLRPATGPAAPRPADGWAPAGWFDGDTQPAGLGIGADLRSASRGLSAAQHAAQVLAHLCGDPPDSL